MTAIANPLALHDHTARLRILAGDPGATAGVTFIEFRARTGNGAPLWIGARLIAAMTIGKPSRKGASAAELDVLHRRRVFERLDELDGGDNVSTATIIALEEPLDGGKVYSDNPSQGQTGQARQTAFRLGVHYAALLHGMVMATGGNGRIISFPAKTYAGRKGWMRGRRDNTLAAAETILQSIATREQWSALPRENVGGLQGMVVDHILMAIGVTNHVVEYFSEYFPREQA